MQQKTTLQDLIKKSQTKKEEKKTNKNPQEQKPQQNQKGKMNLIDLSEQGNSTMKVFSKMDINLSKKEEKMINKEYMNTINANLLNQEEYDPCVYQKPKEIDISSYAKNSVNLYSNIYPIEILKKYTIYSYRVEFLNNVQDMNTFLKKKILSKSFAKLKSVFQTYFFSGDAFYSITEVDEEQNFETLYNSTTHHFKIKPLNDSFTITKNPKDFLTSENKFIIKNIFELIFKDILKGNPNFKMEKNLFIKDLDQRKIANRYGDDQLILKPGYSTKILILENGIYLNVDIKNKIVHSKNCFTLIKEKLRGHKPNKDNIKMIDNYFKGRLVEVKHTDQKMKIDGVCFDKNPKNTTLNLDGKFYYSFFLKLLLKFYFICWIFPY